MRHPSRPSTPADFCIGHLEDRLHDAFASSVRGVHVRRRSLERTLDDYYHRGGDDDNGDDGRLASSLSSPSGRKRGRRGGNDDDLTGGDAPRQRPLVVAGPSGSGKSSSLADWAARRREEAEEGGGGTGCSSGAGGGGGGGGDFVFYHAAGSSRNSVSVGHFLRRLMGALRRRFDLPPAARAEDESDARLPWTFPRVLEKACGKGRVLIVLDGLHLMRQSRGVTEDGNSGCDKTGSGGFNLKWLPRSFPSNARVVLSMTTACEAGEGKREGKGLEGGAVKKNDHIRHRCGKIRHVVQEAERRKWPIVLVEELSKDHVQDMINGIRLIPLEDHGNDHPSASRPLDPICFTQPFSSSAADGSRLTLLPEIERVIASRAIGKNPQFLTMLLRALAYSARQGFDLWTCLEQWDEAGKTEDLIDLVLDDFEVGHQRDQATSHRAKARLTSMLTSGGSESDQSEDYSSDFSQKSDDSAEYSSDDSCSTHRPSTVDQRGVDDTPVYLRGGHDVDGLRPLLGHALALLFVSRHGLHERELWALLECVRKNEKWLKETQQTILPIEIKIFRSLAMNKNRLIDVFRSFDTDGSGTLSHEEIYKGMEQLDADVTKSDVSDLIKVVDTNQDGELDYREMLEHFEDHSKRYMHGKRRESLLAGGLVGSTKGAARKTVRITAIKPGVLDPKRREALLSSLVTLGVTHVVSERVLILPLESTALRDVVWARYIGASKKGRDRWHSVLIDFFSRQEPNLRRCEELPWHLRKCSRYLALRQTLVDLRTFDIMNNNGMAFRAELFDYLRLLTDGAKCDASFDSQDSSSAKNPSGHRGSRASFPPFDIVDEYNHAVEIWYNGTRPTAVRLAAMVTMIGRFMKWFSERMSTFSKPPPFMRTPLDFDKLRNIGLDEAFISKQVSNSYDNDGDRPVTRGSLQNFPQEHQARKHAPGTSDGMYFYDRWIWLQFPWIALQNAPLYCKHMKKDEERRNGLTSLSADTDVANTSSREDEVPANTRTTFIGESSPSKNRFWDIKKEDPYDQKMISNTSTIRDNAMARSESSKKSASIRKVEKIQSTALAQTKGETKPTPANAANIPFAYSTNRTKVHGSRYPSAKVMHHDSLRREEEKLDAIARKATQRFGGQSDPRDFEDVLENLREEEACSNASRGLSASHTSAHSTFVLTPCELGIGKGLQEVADLRDLFNKLKLESKSKEERLKDLENMVAERDLGDRQVHEKVVAGEEILSMLQERLDRLNGLVQDASSLRDFFRQITFSLDSTNPDKHKKNLRSLEQQIALSRQQKDDLLKTKQDIHLEIEGIHQREKNRWRDMRRSSDEKRSQIQCKLKQMRKKNEAHNPETCEEHRPAIRSPLLATKKSFSSRESKLIALDAIGRRKSKGSHSEMDKINASEVDGEDSGGNAFHKMHPMEIIAGITGSFDAGEIAQKLIQSDSREAELQSQQSSHEETIKRLKKKLHDIFDESRECRLTEEECLKEESSASVDMRVIDAHVRNGETMCVQYTKQTEKVLSLANEVASGISHLVEMMDSDFFELHKQRHTPFEPDAGECFAILKEIEEHLCSLVHQSQDLMTKEVNVDGLNQLKAAKPERTVGWEGLSDAKEVSDGEISNPCSPSQIRVLNRNQLDVTFEKEMDKSTAEEDKMIELEEKARVGFDLQKENEHISTFVSEALQTGESRTEQRRANMLSSSKQGKYADRGRIIEAVLQRASEELCQEPRDRPKSGTGRGDNATVDRSAIKEECIHVVRSETAIATKGTVAKQIRAA